MDSVAFEKLAADLRTLASRIPLNWGAVQNNRYDHLVDMFGCETFESLEKAISGFGDTIKQYFRRRWYMWKCAQCDEHLFCENPNVISNPNHKDQGWDIEINGTKRFDIKGTVVPRAMRDAIEYLITDPLPMVKFYYDKQSRGVRYCLQNRLFIIHHSFVAQEREFYLRCAWGIKRTAYHDFCGTIASVKTYNYNGCEAAVLFVLERERGKAEYCIPRKG